MERLAPALLLHPARIAEDEVAVAHPLKHFAMAARLAKIDVLSAAEKAAHLGGYGGFGCSTRVIATSSRRPRAITEEAIASNLAQLSRR